MAGGSPLGAGESGACPGCWSRRGRSLDCLPSAGSRALVKGDEEEAAIVARLDALRVHARGQGQLHLEWALTNGRRMVRGAFRARGKLSMSLDHEHVLEELHLEVVLRGPGEIHDDLDRPGRLVQVRVGAPPGPHGKAKAVPLPRA